ncbi:Armadillo-like helical [Penicillium chermesinum]|nr:Armadillo-like helical [Penicillium chermesinum]
MASTTLRAVAHRLTTTPVEQLPSIASFLATSLSDCADLLSAPQTQKPGKSDSENAIQVHKLKTRLSSLLQDRSVEGRWTAVVLAKAMVEAGQWEVLRGYEPIVRSLIGILAKPDPVSTRKMCIITLTRIFHLTYQYPTLVREITTPHLPGFITAALNLVSTLVKLPSGSARKAKPNTPFMETVLLALLELIPRHPTIFRPFGSQLRSLSAEILGSQDVYFRGPVIDAAEQVFASLHKCAPKDKSGSGWNEDCRSTILSIHRATDFVYRAVVEQWESVDTTLVATRQNYNEELADPAPDALGLPAWKGIHAGSDRILTLLRILSDFIAMPSVSAVALPLGSILDLTSRLTTVTVPLEGTSQSGAQANPQIGREERELLWAELPRIHIACMDLLAHVVNVLGTSAIPLAQTMLEQVSWVFRNEKFSRDVRTASYDLLASLISLNGPAMTKQSMAPITSGDSKTKSKAQGTANADSFLNPDLQKGRNQQASKSSALGQAASALLQSVLLSAPSELLAASMRAEIDRTIILISDKDAMLASVLNPVPAIKGKGAGASIIPFLARGYSDTVEVESLIRPRMPVIMTAPELDAQALAEEEDEDEEMEVAEHEPVSETASFLKFSTSNVVPAKSEPVEATNKRFRTYIEEPTLKAMPEPSENQLERPKKARIEESVHHPAPVAAIASTPHPAPVSQQTQAKPQASAAPEASMPEDDSDDELPTLNLDPDTDDDEEDDDVQMEG